jgi:hypothetical protein
MRKFNPAVYINHKWLSGCAERNALLSLLINHLKPSGNCTYHQV